MNLKLKWTNPNVVATSVKIYRSTTQIDRANLGTALVTLTAGETEWIDTTAVRGTTYYYVWETTTATDRSVSQNQKIVAGSRRGPGPQSLLQGDMELGYFGEMLGAEMLSTNELRAAVGMAIGAVIVPSVTWHKYARKGKVLIVPKQALVSGVTWLQLYNLGLVYGTDDNGKGTFLPTPTVNQKRTVKIGPDTFIVRLMSGYSDVVTDVPPAAENTAEPNDAFLCEWEDLIYPLFQYVPNKQRLINTANYTAALMGFNSNYYCHVQERGSSTNNIVRGSNVAGRQNVSNRGNVPSTQTATVSWWPVLELIDTAV